MSVNLPNPLGGTGPSLNQSALQEANQAARQAASQAATSMGAKTGSNATGAAPSSGTNNAGALTILSSAANTSTTATGNTGPAGNLPVPAQTLPAAAGGSGAAGLLGAAITAAGNINHGNAAIAASLAGSSGGPVGSGPGVTAGGQTGGGLQVGPGAILINPPGSATPPGTNANGGGNNTANLANLIQSFSQATAGQNPANPQGTSPAGLSNATATGTGLASVAATPGQQSLPGALAQVTANNTNPATEVSAQTKAAAASAGKETAGSTTLRANTQNTTQPATTALVPSSPSGETAARPLPATAANQNLNMQVNAAIENAENTGVGSHKQSPTRTQTGTNSPSGADSPLAAMGNAPLQQTDQTLSRASLSNGVETDPVVTSQVGAQLGIGARLGQVLNLPQRLRSLTVANVASLVGALLLCLLLARVAVRGVQAEEIVYLSLGVILSFVLMVVPTWWENSGR